MLKTSFSLLTGLAIAATPFLSTETAQAALLQFTSSLDGAQEVPPVSTPGRGSAQGTLDTDTDELSWNIEFSDLLAPPILAHFHGPAAPGSEAGVKVDIAAISGLTSPLIGSAIVAPQDVVDIIAGLWYINIHTDLFPGGEIRGQVQVFPIQVDPEPSSLGFVGVTGLILLGYGWQKYQQRSKN